MFYSIFHYTKYCILTHMAYKDVCRMTKCFVKKLKHKKKMFFNIKSILHVIIEVMK